MVERLAETIIDWQIKKHYLEPKDRAMYCYAYELLIGQAMNLLIACLLMIVFHAYLVLLVYLIAYIPLRSYAGGHHASSSNACTLISAGVLALVCIGANVIPTNAYIYINAFSTAIGTWFMLWVVPVEAVNKPLDQAERVLYRKRSIEIWIIEVIAWSILYGLGFQTASFSIGLAHITEIFFLCLGICMNKQRGSLS